MKFGFGMYRCHHFFRETQAKLTQVERRNKIAAENIFATPALELIPLSANAGVPKAEFFEESMKFLDELELLKPDDWFKSYNYYLRSL